MGGSSLRPEAGYLTVFAVFLINAMLILIWQPTSFSLPRLRAAAPPTPSLLGLQSIPWAAGKSGEVLREWLNSTSFPAIVKQGREKYGKAHNMTWIIAITPVKQRLLKKADLTRLSQTFQLVPCLHWIVVEDAPLPTGKVSRLLRKSGLPFTHLATKTPNGTKGRGMPQRNLALFWLRNQTFIPKEHIMLQPSVTYFADDDNTYDLRLFEFLRQVKKVGVWPVGVSGGGFVDAPKVIDGKVVAWDTVHAKTRKFATDMAGFGVNTDLILEKNPTFHNKCTRGFFESCFLKQLDIGLPDELEPFGVDSDREGVKDIVVWHTKTLVPSRRRGEQYGFDI